MKIVRLDPWLKHSERKRPVSTIVLHHTAGGTAQSTIEHLARPLTFASYHYIVDRDGTVYKCVPTTAKAWHCGVSNGPQGRDVNQYSIGIALANKGDGEDYPAVQVSSALELVGALIKADRHIRWITSHRLITKRKVDPANFAFKSFAQKATLMPWRDDRLGREWDG